LNGKIIVADAGNNVIKRMDADGTNIATLATGFSSPSHCYLKLTEDFDCQFWK
jgi:hypothetical protein